MSKQTAVQDTVNAVAVATQAINDYGLTSPQAQGALDAARQAATTARAAGATDDDFHAARPH
ncbi:hypothetical protein [Streptomyces lavendofoliae]|uniref:Uncharacterized protein n=1 Tax=Streptomyces lavendofoliae TaxID=67314 RepID=A0A918I3W8_9ACTN|nr:hypothetical protein [Streptomyces lavendofoliae]GGU62580.1 hypothetical protein GCM10010274_59220 [Streptomyces lavendofoliae]